MENKNKEDGGEMKRERFKEEDDLLNRGCCEWGGKRWLLCKHGLSSL